MAGNTTPPSVHGVSIAGLHANIPSNAPHGALYWASDTQKLMVYDAVTQVWITFTPSAVS